MPNTRVRWRAAFIGALFGGAAWVGVGAIFTRIAVYATQAAAIYAGFAIVLLFMMWLHLSWLIMLLGGQLSFYVQHPEHLRTGHGEIPTTSALRERIALGAMYLLGERFVAGGPRWKVSDLADHMDVPASVLDGELSLLEDRGLVLTAEDDTVAPGRDLGSITLAEILDAIRHETPEPAPARTQAAAHGRQCRPRWLTTRCVPACRRRRCAICCATPNRPASATVVG